MEPVMKPMLAAAALVVLASPAFAAGEFAQGSEATSWGLLGEEKARFEAVVVDVLCELTGDCPADCGGGGRYLGLRRAADEALVLANKNLQAVFTGAVEELLPYCGKTVEVDGLLVGVPEMTPAKVYQVQRLREPGGEWHKADHWTKAWDESHPELAGVEGRWYRKDPRVMGEIEADGYLGLGLATDAEFIDYLFEE
jgi:hypothetical protein